MINRKKTQRIYQEEGLAVALPPENWIVLS